MQIKLKALEAQMGLFKMKKSKIKTSAKQIKTSRI